MILRYGINRKTKKRKYGRRVIEHRNRELEIVDDATGDEIVEAIMKANPGWMVTGFKLPDSYNLANYDKWGHGADRHLCASPRAGA